MATISVEEENYVRMSLLLTGISPRAVRIKFDLEFHPTGLDASLKKEYNKLSELKRKKIISESQWNVLFPRFPDVPDSRYFDVSLMLTLLRNLATLTPPRGGFDRLPPVIEISTEADLARIKYYRNYLAHLSDGKIDTTFFNTAWTDITEAIDRLGKMKQECDHLKTKPLDQTNREIMMDIKRSYDEIKELKKSFKSLKRSHELLQGKHENVEKSNELLQENYKKVKISNALLQEQNTEVRKAHELLQEDYMKAKKNVEEIMALPQITEFRNTKAREEEERRRTEEIITEIQNMRKRIRIEGCVIT
ncbi:uncharacterized protein LOC143069539 [Mytilus galloprovincialis]|uniref:uncharacterized protein LOC143069539 n=1 Tax=Mytilus galloprovincialis TaxID=29158 RepID=UPI003F7B85C4